jgi:DNA polymerase elongation subunit (family B)
MTEGDAAMTEIGIDYKADDRDAIRRLCLDIETAKCPDVDMEIERAIVKPSGNFKDTKTGTAEEKKAKQIAAKREAVEDDDGVLDMNPIACIGIEADGQLWHFSWFPEDTLEPLKDVAKLVLAGDEREMLKRFTRWCDAHCDESTLTLTWNGYGFDLSKIRHRCAMYNVKLPDIFAPESPNRNIDLMHVYANKYTVNKALRKFVGQPVACKLLKIDSKTKEMSDVAGANFPQAIADGKYYRGALYNLFDVVDLSEIGARMGY